jgi:hypothetical protein
MEYTESDRKLWIQLFMAALTGVCAAQQTPTIWNGDQIAEDAEHIADSALELCKEKPW